MNRFYLKEEGLTSEEAREIERLLGDGALIIYPTDTLYAIGCRALDDAAVTRLREAKGREASKPLPVIAADLLQARSLASRWPPEAQRLADAFWPGPLTLVVPAAPTLPSSLLAGGSSVAVRVPASTLARALALLAGPIVATSANASGERPCTTVDQAIAAFPAGLVAVDVGPLDGEPSTIVDLTSADGAFRILRPGRISRDLVHETLKA